MNASAEDRWGRWAIAAIAHVGRVARGAALPAGLRVTVNFHPDRGAEGASVVQQLARTGRYLPQFVTGTSNGGLTAHPGGNRWRWEHEMFGGAYDTAPADRRPIYGALDDLRAPLGGAPRFGSAYLRLTAEVTARTTFCFPDSVFGPTDFATAERFELLPLVEEFRAESRTDLDEAQVGGALDSYVEAQIHGGVLLSRDVEALVLDPAFRGTPVE